MLMDFKKANEYELQNEIERLRDEIVVKDAVIKKLKLEVKELEEEINYIASTDSEDCDNEPWYRKFLTFLQQ